MEKKKRKSSGNNKVIIALISILFICFCLLGYGFYKYFYAGNNDTKYGDRLEGIEKHKLSNNLLDDIKELYTADTVVGEITTNTQGRIIYINMDFDETVTVEVAKELASKALGAIGEDNLSFYDVQFVLTQSYDKESTESGFPVFGAKSSTSLKVIW